MIFLLFYDFLIILKLFVHWLRFQMTFKWNLNDFLIIFKWFLHDLLNDIYTDLYSFF